MKKPRLLQFVKISGKGPYSCLCYLWPFRSYVPTGSISESAAVCARDAQPPYLILACLAGRACPPRD